MSGAGENRLESWRDTAEMNRLKQTGYVDLTVLI
jgi:hypothetical protein